MPETLRVKWSAVALVSTIVAVGSLVALVIVAATNGSEVLATVALALAILSFVVQLAATAFQAHETSSANVRAEQLNNQTLALLRSIETASAHLRETVAGQFDRVLTAALASAVPGAVGHRPGLDTEALADRIRSEVLDYVRTADVSGAADGPPQIPAPAQRAALTLAVGDEVSHPKFGYGTVVLVDGEGEKSEAVVDFKAVGEKRLLLAWAPLTRIFTH